MRPVWLIPPTTEEQAAVPSFLATGESVLVAINPDDYADDETVGFEVLLAKGNAEVWAGMTVQGERVRLNNQYSCHSFSGPLCFRVIKSATVSAAGVSVTEG